MAQFCYLSGFEVGDRRSCVRELCLNEFDEGSHDAAVHKICGVSVIADEDSTFIAESPNFWVIRRGAIRKDFPVVFDLIVARGCCEYVTSPA